MGKLQENRKSLRYRTSGRTEESDKLPEPIYTPSTKAEIGDHDENISFEQSVTHLENTSGEDRNWLRNFVTTPLRCIKKCAEYALSKGIIIADTKFEFGLDEEGNMVIGDEMLTPDSSRSGRQMATKQDTASHLSINSLPATG